MSDVACCTQRSKTFSKSFASFEAKMDSFFLPSWFYETKMDSVFFSFLILYNPKSNWKV